jgi:signal transduction histidine kinase
MRVPRLIRTTVFRLSLLYALAFSILTAVVLGFVFVSTQSYLTERITETLQTDLATLLEPDTDASESGGGRDTRDLIDRIKEIQHFDKTRGGIVALSNSAGKILAGNLLHWPQTIEHKNGSARFDINDSAIPPALRQRSDDFDVLVLVHALPNGNWLLVGQQLADEEDLSEYIGSLFILALLLITLMGLLGGVVMGRAALKQIDQIRNAAQKIARGDLTERLPVHSKRQNEFDEIAIELNRTLDRIDALIKGMREVTDNVAHDLRSPLNRLRTRLEVALLDHNQRLPCQQILNESVEDLQGILSTFNTLLSISQAEAGIQRIPFSPQDLSALCRDMGELYEASAEEEYLNLHTDCTTPLMILGNRDLLAQALSNLIDNAIKYTPRGGRITLRTTQLDTWAELRLCDTGTGIPPDQYTHVFQRFVRLDTARNLPGNGLGLAQVLATITAHRGEIHLSDNQPGLCIQILLPLSAA